MDLMRVIRGLFAPLVVRDVVYVQDRSDVPDRPNVGVMFVVGDTTLPKWAILACPCKQGHRLEVNLQRSHWPHWRLDFVRGRPSLYPSIWVRFKPFCHFFLSEGRVFWVYEWPWQ